MSLDPVIPHQTLHAARVFVSGITLIVALGGCVSGGTEPSLDLIRLWTQDGAPGGHECGGPEITGRLATSERWGLAVVDVGTGSVRAVSWPPAFAAARDRGAVALLDQSRQVVAREGDTIRVPGESHPDPDNADGIWFACRNITTISRVSG
jgi:hypothetical protein